MAEGCVRARSVVRLDGCRRRGCAFAVLADRLVAEGQERAALARWVEEGPDLERDGVVRWRCRDLQERISSEFRVSLHERTVGKLLAKLRFRRLSVRPQHPQSDPAAQATFKGASLIG